MRTCAREDEGVWAAGGSERRGGFGTAAGDGLRACLPILVHVGVVPDVLAQLPQEHDSVQDLVDVAVLVVVDRPVNYLEQPLARLQYAGVGLGLLLHLGRHVYLLPPLHLG
jgi:hypothetical protein